MSTAKKIAAANWKMNLTLKEGLALVDDLLQQKPRVEEPCQVILAVPFPYIGAVMARLQGHEGYAVAAQNCHQLNSGAYTGEVAAPMLASLGVPYCLVGHSERREYQAETHAQLAQKLQRCMEQAIRPIFCCGEPLPVRDQEAQNAYVQRQLEESLFVLDKEQIKNAIVAYEPIWAIGTGRTASAQQAQEMHQFIRSVIADRYGSETAQQLPILYGGSVKASNAQELFACPDVDGGLVGGASLVASEFAGIIEAL